LVGFIIFNDCLDGRIVVGVGVGVGIAVAVGVGVGGLASGWSSGLYHAIHRVFSVIAHSIKPPVLQCWQSSGLKNQVAAVGFVID